MSEVSVPDRRPSVLIVDDDRAVVDSLTDALREDGFHVACVSKADDVAQAFRSDRPHVVLIDLLLDTRAGIEIAQDLRDQDTSVPLVAVSGSQYMTELARESDLFAAVVDKPFDVDDMEATLLEVVREKIGR